MTPIIKFFVALGLVGAGLALAIGVVAMVAAWYSRADR